MIFPKTIYAYVDKFDFNVTEFTVYFIDGIISSHKYTTYDFVGRFIKDLIDDYEDLLEFLGAMESIENNYKYAFDIIKSTRIE